MSLRDSRVESSKRQEVDEGESTADDVSMTEHTQSSMIVDLKKLAKKSSEQYVIRVYSCLFVFIRVYSCLFVFIRVHSN